MKNATADKGTIWDSSHRQFDLIARNVSIKYVALAVEMAIGLVLLPFNVAYLGQSAYGLWMLMASVTIYFSMLDLGYGDALVKFTVQYRSKRDPKALNQIASTMFVIFAGIGLITYSLAALLALNLNSVFNLTSEQATTGRSLLLITSAYVALSFPFSVFGAIVNGFQRNYMNGIIAIIVSITAAAVNVAVLLAGYGLVELVAATYAVRIASYVFYRMSAYHVFPLLRIRPGFFKLARLREVTSFSIFIVLIDIAAKLNYWSDSLVIGAFMSTAAVAVYAVALRLVQITQRLTNQLNEALFPVIVDNAAGGRQDRLQLILLQGTRLSMAMVIPMAAGLVLLADPFIMAWVGPRFSESVPLIYILSAAITFKVGTATARTLLKGAGRHRLLAATNISTGIANLALSIMLVQRYGLIGVALGTLIPVALALSLVLFPTACRHVGLPIRRALMDGVWPAIWPVTVMAAFLLVTRRLAGVGLASVGIQALLAGAIYIFVYLKFAIRREERLWYAAKGRQLLRRPRIATAL